MPHFLLYDIVHSYTYVQYSGKLHTYIWIYVGEWIPLSVPVSCSYTCNQVFWHSHTRAHTHAHTRTHTTHTRTHTHTHAHTHAHTHMHTHARAHTHTNTSFTHSFPHICTTNPSVSQRLGCLSIILTVAMTSHVSQIICLCYVIPLQSTSVHHTDSLAQWKCTTGTNVYTCVW